MKEQLEERLKELRAEYDAGQKMLTELEGKQTELRSTMLRITGAIQVIEELLGKENRADSGNGADNRDVKAAAHME